MTESKKLEEIEEFHFHTYYLQNNQESKAEALRLRSGLEKLISTGYATIVLNKVNEGPLGPHLIGSFETWCGKHDLSKMISWFMLNHGSLSILLHPLTQHEKLDHTTRAMWLGQPLPLDLSVLQGTEAASSRCNVTHCAHVFSFTPDDLGRIPSQKPLAVPKNASAPRPISPRAGTSTLSVSPSSSARSVSPLGRERPNTALLQRCVILEGLPDDVSVLELSEAFTSILTETPGFIRLRLMERATACVEFKTEDHSVEALERLKSATFRNLQLKARIPGPDG